MPPAIQLTASTHVETARPSRARDIFCVMKPILLGTVMASSRHSLDAVTYTLTHSRVKAKRAATRITRRETTKDHHVSTQLSPLILGNWKMNGLSTDLPAIRNIDEIAGLYAGVEVGLALPFTLIPGGAAMLKHTMIGAQNCHARQRGAFTGEVSAAMLVDCGASFVILGHSERRQGQSEDNDTVRQKVRAAIEAGLKVILCVGESLQQREAGQADAVVRRQLVESLPDAPIAAPLLTIAYEPVWAIGTGLTPDAQAIEEMHRVIYDTLQSIGHPPSTMPRLLYGGSVSADNAADILRLPLVDGALVGNASLGAPSFSSIIRQASCAT
jgi:triosephosphate isomerase